VRLEPSMLRVWPGMDAREAAAPVLDAAAELLGRPVLAGARGGASDASHLAVAIPVTIDGLGPLGGDAHHPDEYVVRGSLRRRAEVALATALAVFGR
jgi:glutamate carboxypeptidase